MVIVGLVPLVVSHYFLIGINRDSLETLEQKYLTRSAVGIATDMQNLLTNNTQQLTKIAGSVRAMKKALPAGTDPFTYAAQTGVIADYITPDSDLLGLRILNRDGQGAEAKPAELDAAVRAGDRPRAAKPRSRDRFTPARSSTSRPRTSRRSSSPCRSWTTAAIIGAVEAMVSLRRIGERIREEGKGDVTAFLVDRDGRVLMHSEPAVDVQHPDFSHLKIVQEFNESAGAPHRVRTTTRAAARR